ncbi:MAG: hypothetical protein ACKVQU_34200 [Burkholderiales bacterium]
MQRSWKSLIGAVAVLAATGCAQFNAPSTPPGMAANDVRSRLGAPTDMRTVGGVKVWDYATGPQGFTTWRMTFDNADRVAKVEQILTAQRIHGLKPNQDSRDDVVNLLGRPAETSRFGGTGTEVLTYRFIDVQDRMLGDVFIDAGTGKVKATAIYRDPAYSTSHST